jgi:hypothetical protein
MSTDPAPEEAPAVEALAAAEPRAALGSVITLQRSGSWIAPTDLVVQRSGAWVGASEVLVYRFGAWVSLWKRAG